MLPNFRDIIARENVTDIFIRLYNPTQVGHLVVD